MSRGEKSITDVYHWSKAAHVIPFFPFAHWHDTLLDWLWLSRSRDSGCNCQYLLQLLYIWTILHHFYREIDTKRWVIWYWCQYCNFFLTCLRLSPCRMFYGPVLWSFDSSSTFFLFLFFRNFNGIGSPRISLNCQFTLHHRTYFRIFSSFCCFVFWSTLDFFILTWYLKSISIT